MERVVQQTRRERWIDHYTGGHALLAGTHRNPPPLFQLCPCWLLPICWNEPFGLAPVEAMATGTPVIAFRNGAVEEIIIHGKTGFLVDAGDCEQAATYVADLHTLSRALCRKHVETHFSLERMLDAYEQLYLALSQKA